MIRFYALVFGALSCSAVLAAPPAHGAELTQPLPFMAADSLAADDSVTFTPLELSKPFGAAGTVFESQLAAIAGRANVDQKAIGINSSNVSGNSVNGNSVTGDIAIDNGAFGNFNGLAVLSANTGNNVSINASMNVNVSIQP